MVSQWQSQKSYPGTKVQKFYPGTKIPQSVMLVLDCPANLYFPIVNDGVIYPFFTVVFWECLETLARVPNPFFPELNLSVDFDYIIY